MGGVLGILPAFALRFLDLLRLGPAPTTNIYAAVPATVLCPVALDDAGGAIRAFLAAQV